MMDDFQHDAEGALMTIQPDNKVLEFPSKFKKDKIKWSVKRVVANSVFKGNVQIQMVKYTTTKRKRGLFGIFRETLVKFKGLNCKFH